MVLDMLEIIILSMLIIYIIKLILRHNVFISNIKLNIKFIGLNLEIQSKEKKHPSR